MFEYLFKNNDFLLIIYLGLMVPGARVEAKDFSEQWYAARIMEVDHEELEVLIHYDNWSQR